MPEEKANGPTVEAVQQAWSIGDSSTRELLSRLWPEAIAPLLKMDIRFIADAVDNDYTGEIVEGKHERALLCRRQTGNLAHRGFWLSPAFEWKIVVDNEGTEVLTFKALK